MKAKIRVSFLDLSLHQTLTKKAPESPAHCRLSLPQLKALHKCPLKEVFMKKAEKIITEYGTKTYMYDRMLYSHAYYLFIFIGPQNPINALEVSVINFSLIN